MSSATSTDGLQPWQFFLLAGMLAATVVVLVVGGQSPAAIVLLSITVVAASLVALGAYRAFSPLVSPDSFEAPQLIVGRTRAALEREKTLVLRSIKELEFDYAMGKVGKADFDDVGARLRARAIGLMRQLDEGGGYRQEIEKELERRLRADAHTTPGSLPHEGQGFSPGNQRQQQDTVQTAPNAALVTDSEGSASPKGSAFSCECGTVNDPDARFCKGCGNRLAAA